MAETTDQLPPEDDRRLNVLADKVARRSARAIRQAQEPVLDALGQIHAAVKDSNKPVIEKLNDIEGVLGQMLLVLSDMRDVLGDIRRNQ